jgi:LacI family transcriptional regulator
MPRVRHVAVIVDAADPFDRKIISGVADYAKESGNWSLYIEVHPLERLPDLAAWHGHGIIASFDDRKVAAAVRGLKTPVVGVGGGSGWYDPASGIPYVAGNQAAIGRQGAEHLMDRGFRRLAFYGYPCTRFNRWSDERAQAFRQRAADAGIKCSIYTGRHETVRRWSELQRGLVTWLRSLETPIGLMACNDAKARHVLEACRTAGLRVPDDLAVVGVDNDQMICDLTDPPLSSIEQGARRMGYHAARLLDRLMSGRKPALRLVVEPEGVVVRRSTDTLAIDDAELADAIRFIRDHACQGIKIGDVVRQVAVSHSTLASRFKAALGRTIHGEIERVRLERARELIAETSLPLKQVALRSGFKYVQYMTRLFRRRFGRTPAQFRGRND